MKIDRLFTLSQFIDFMKNEEKESNTNWRFDQILKYNDFLKQPLKKEMFVCEVEMPIFPNRVGLENFEQILVDRYQYAKKKVIFDGMKPISGGNQFVCDSGYKGAFRVICPNDYKTLHNLAEATNGELKLKNIEL